MSTSTPVDDLARLRAMFEEHDWTYAGLGSSEDADHHDLLVMIADQALQALADAVAQPPERPEPDPKWHPLAIEWFESLATSDQAWLQERCRLALVEWRAAKAALIEECRRP